MYVCKSIQGSQCFEWQELSGLYQLANLSVEEGMLIGGGFLSLCVFAYFGRTILLFINRL